jgi:hypothetical protein
VAAAHTLTLLEDVPLPGGYRQLTFRSESALARAAGPGHYLRSRLAPDAQLLHAPLMSMHASDRLQVLARTQTRLMPGTTMENAFIEGAAPLPDPDRPRIALVSADVALACAIFAASRLRKQYDLSVFARFDDVPPFQPVPSQILMPAAPPEAIAAVPLLDSWDIPSRLSSAAEQSGFYHGDIRGMLEHWWQRLNGNERAKLQVLGFGDEPFLRIMEKWCRAHAIPLRTAEIPA